MEAKQNESFFNLENNSFFQFFSKRRYLKRLGILFVHIFFPWAVILKLRKSLRELAKINGSIKTENVVLSQKILDLQNINQILSGLKQDLPCSAITGRDHFISVDIKEVSGMLNWPELLSPIERNHGFNEWLRVYRLYISNSATPNSPSNCWALLASKNCGQLLDHGYLNFKRTIGLNYFNFLIQEGDVQIKSIEALLPSSTLALCRKQASSIPHDPAIKLKDQFPYNYFVLMLWEYVKKIDKRNYLSKVSEPQEGNPILVCANGECMSQDLANSLIEYYSMEEVVSFDNISTVLEIGAGYGRNAYVTLKLNPKIQIFVVDIWPALYIAQRYLSTVFENHNIFQVNDFVCYDDVKDQIENASIIFLLPHQLALLPDKKIDLTMNISSFGEMDVDQINWYFSQIERLTSQYFYTKQWNNSPNPFDNLSINKNDYPYSLLWKEIFSRNCAVQTDFFESLFRVEQL